MASERSPLTLPDLALVMTKHHDNRLGFAVLLVFFRNRGRFPRTAGEIDPTIVEEIAQQLAVAAPPRFTPNLSGRTAERHRAEIRALRAFARRALPMRSGSKIGCAIRWQRWARFRISLPRFWRPDAASC